MGFRTSAAATKAPRTDGKVYIGNDLDQASISIAVGDTIGELGAGPSSEQGFRVRSGRIADPGAANSLTGLHFSVPLGQRTDGGCGRAEIQIPPARASKSQRARPTGCRRKSFLAADVKMKDSYMVTSRYDMIAICEAP